MRINLLALFSFLAVFGLSTNTFAQKSSTGINIDLDGSNSVREVIFPTHSQTGLQICGLQKGEEYTIILLDDEKSSGVSTTSSSQFQKKIVITAQNNCHALGLRTNYEQGKAQQPPIVSVVCKTCDYIEPFAEKSMMGVIGVPNLNADQLVQDVFIGGDCFETSGATTDGSPLSIGTFTGALPVFGFDDGIILSSGYVSGTVGPSTIFNSSVTGGSSSDPDLESIATSTINDVAILEFDFVPTVDQVSFEYVFASEEYCQYAPPNNSNVNDLFGFFLSGPGIAGTINIAEVSAGVPVSINNVNPVTNAAFFNANGDNCGGGGAATGLFGYNGFTDVFTAVANVIPCETYHIKLAIADGGDDVWDSSVFLKANSFDAGGAAIGSAAVPLTGSNDAYESDACGNAFFTFTRESGDLLTPVIVDYSIGGTATNGIDYTGLPPSPIIIPPGVNQLTIPITITQDNIAEGIETVTLFLFGACTCTSAEVTLNIYDLADIDVDVPDVELCGNLGVPALITANASGGLPLYFYDWGSGPSPVNLITDTPTENTSYTVTVTDMCGAEGVGTGNLEYIILNAILDGSASLCGNSGSASLNVNFSGSDGPFEILYSIDGVIQPAIDNITDNPYTLDINETGTYELEFVTIDGCLGDASGAVVVAGSSTELATAFTDATCVGTNSGSINLTVTNAAGAVDYLWSNGSTLEDQASLPAGDYTVTVTSGGCEIIESFTLAENPLITASVASTQGVDCSNPTIGAIDIDSGGGNGTLTFAWSNAATTEDLTDLASGNYSVTISDINNCQVILDNIMVTGSTDVPTANAIQSGNIDCNNTMVTLSATGSTTGANITYEWVDQDNTVIETGPDADEIIVGAAGTYTLTVTNTVGNCFAQAPLTITVDNIGPFADAGSLQTLDCNNETVQLNGTASANGANISYEWTGPGGSIILDDATNTATVDMVGTYTLTVTNTTNGCPSTATVVVDDNIIDPTIILGVIPDLDCSTDDVDLDATGSSTGGFSYQWTTIGAGNILGATTLTPNVDAEGDYELVVTNDNTGCTTTETVTITDVSVLPNVSIVAPEVITCSMDTIMLDASASDSGNGLVIEWTTTSGFGSLSDPTSLTPIVDGGGTFLLTISNPATGCEAQMPITVTETTTPPIAIIDTPGAIDCDDPTVTLTTSTSTTGPDISYAWAVITGNGTIIDDMTNEPTVDAPGLYELVVTDNSTGCSAIANVSVTGDPETPVAVVDYDSDINCNSISSNITGSGSSVGSSFSYAWDLDGTVLDGQNSFSLNNLNTPGVYTLTVSNSNNGCMASNSVTIALDTITPVAIVTTMDILDCNNSEIELDGSFSSQSDDISYLWTATDNSAFTTTTDTITPSISAVGTYYLTVTNTTNGCVAVDSIVVTSNDDLPIIDIDQPEPIDCIDLTQEITSTITGTGPNITYVWTGTGIIDGEDTNSPTVNESGTFTLTVTDNDSGCLSTETVIVDDITAQPTADAGMPAILNCDNNTLQLSAGGSAGIGTLSYEWTATNGGIIDSASSIINPTISTAGTYTVVVTDQSNGCQETAEVIITGDVIAPIAAAGLGGEINCFDESLALDGTGSSANDVTYLWTAENGGSVPVGQENIIDPVITTAGTYLLTVTSNINNCSSSDFVVITSNTTDPIIDIEQPSAIDCIDFTQIITSTATGSDITYAWTGTGIIDGEDTNIPTVSEGGLFTLTVTNNLNGCATTETIIVDDIRELPTADAGLTAIVNCDNETLELNAGASSGMGTLSYEWSATNGGVIDADADMINPTISAAGTYTVLVTDASNGCEQLAEVIITEDFTPPLAVAGIDDQFNCGDESLSLNGVGSSTGDVTYLWSAENGGSVPTDQEGLITPTIMTSGIYNLLVTNNENGCTATDQVIILEDENAPILEVASEGDITCLAEIIGLTATISNIGADFDYTWTIVNGIGNFESGETTLTPAVDAPGTYEFSVVNNENNCDALYSITIDEDTEEPTVALSVSNVIDCNFEETTLNTVGSDNTAGFDLVWTNDMGQTIPNGTENPIVTVEGQYTLTITNTVNGCFEALMVNVVEDTEIPTVVATSDDDITCLEETAPLSGLGSSTGNDFSYSWINLTTGAVVGTELNMTIDEAGDYQLLVTNDVNGCFDTQITNVALDAEFPVVQVAEAEVLNCITTATELDGTGSDMGDDISYLWTVISGTGTITGDVTTLNPSIDGPGVYELTVSNDANDCADTQQVTVTENTDEPTITVGDAGNITCSDSEVTLSANSTNGGNFMWTGGVDIQNPETASPTVTSAGTYTVTAIHNETGCEGTAMVNVDEDLDLPSVDAGAAYLINCETGSVTLSGTSDVSNASYIWTNGSGDVFTGQNVDVTAGGSYTLTVTNLENECSDSADTQVANDQPNALTTDPIDADCVSGFGSVVVSDVVGGSPGYTFSIDGGDTFTQNTAFTQLVSGSYDVIVQDLNGCEYSEQFVIGAPEELILVMEDMVELKLGETYQFDPQINKDEDILTTIIWTPEDSLSCVDCLTPLATPTESTRYTLLLKDSLGCTAEASTLIIVNRQSSVFIPTAFSPNNDGNNEVFYVFADDRNVDQLVSFQVYNRWGETVHEYFGIPANAPDFGWDGTYRGQALNPGVFAYVVKVRMSDGRTETFTGDVTLQR
jgi:gliding motility-associated-like protein